MIHTGPPVIKKENGEEFLKKWINNKLVIKKPYQKNDRWYVEIKRQYIDAKEFLEKEFKKLSLGKHINKVVYKKFEIRELTQIS